MARRMHCDRRIVAHAKTLRSTFRPANPSLHHLWHSTGYAVRCYGPPGSIQSTRPPSRSSPQLPCAAASSRLGRHASWSVRYFDPALHTFQRGARGSGYTLRPISAGRRTLSRWSRLDSKPGWGPSRAACHWLRAGSGDAGIHCDCVTTLYRWRPDHGGQRAGPDSSGGGSVHAPDSNYGRAGSWPRLSTAAACGTTGSSPVTCPISSASPTTRSPSCCSRTCDRSAARPDRPRRCRPARSGSPTTRR